jgi:hypothetical protein
MSNKMKNKKNTTMLQQFQNSMEKSVGRGKIKTLPHKYVTTHFPGLLQTLQYKVAG